MAICRFGPFEFDARSGELKKSGQDEVLPPLQAKLLQILTDHAGALVGREQIAESLWAKNPPADVRVAINRCVAELRARLGDDASDPAYIQAIPARGFKFIMPVEKGNRRQDLNGRLKRRSPVVGREDEKARLRDALGSVSSGHGLLLCVTGDSGLGKTTLVEDFLSDLMVPDAGCMIARGRCSEQLEGGEGYVPFLEAVSNLVDGGSDEPIAQLLREIAPTWYFKVRPPSVDNPAPSFISDESRMRRELCTFLQRISRDQPVLFFFDDFHWADRSSIALLNYIATRFESMRILLVVTYRPPEVPLGNNPFPRMLLDLQTRGFCREVPLELLSCRAIERYLALEFPNNEFTPEFPLLIHGKTEGNPLFMVDLLQHLEHRGVIANKDGHWVLALELPNIERDLPVGHAMIERKIGQLSDPDRRLLTVAGVQGQEFDSVILATVLSIDTEDVEETLKRLDKVHAFVRLLESNENQESMPNVRYRFVHSLYRNAICASVVPARTSFLSLAVANALINIFHKKSDIAGQAAALFETGRDFTKAAVHFDLAARNATSLFANREAINLATRGLAALKNLPEGRERLRQELRLLLALGVPMGTTKGCSVAEVEKVYTRAHKVYDELGDTDEFFPVLAGLWAYYLVRADLENARALAERLLHRAQSESDGIAELEAHRALGHTLTYLGEIEPAQYHFEQVVGLNDAQQHASYLFFNGLDPAVTCRSFMGLNLWLLGYPERALQHVDEAVCRGGIVSHPLSLAFALDFACGIHQLRGDTQKLQERAKLLSALSGEHGLSLFLAYGSIWQGWALVSHGQGIEGIEYMRTAINSCRTAGADLSIPHFLGLLAEAYWKTGQDEQGLEIVAQALEVANKTRNHYYDAELYRLKGELLLARLADGRDEAEVSFRSAIGTARQQKSRSLELKACMSLSRLLGKRGKDSEALGELAQSYAAFTEGFDTADLREARVLLDSRQ